MRIASRLTCLQRVEQWRELTAGRDGLCQSRDLWVDALQLGSKCGHVAHARAWLHRCENAIDESSTTRGRNTSRASVSSTASSTLVIESRTLFVHTAAPRL